VSSQTTLIELCQKLRDNEFSWPRRGKLAGWKKWTPPRSGWLHGISCGTNQTGFNKKVIIFYIFITRCSRCRYKSSVKRLVL
jgi:hypothetical protein